MTRGTWDTGTDTLRGKGDAETGVLMPPSKESPGDEELEEAGRLPLQVAQGLGPARPQLGLPCWPARHHSPAVPAALLVWLCDGSPWGRAPSGLSHHLEVPEDTQGLRTPAGHGRTPAAWPGVTTAQLFQSFPHVQASALCSQSTLRAE